MTLFFLYLFPVFLLVFVLIIYKSEKVFTTTKQSIIILICSVAIFCMVFIPGGVTINASTDWKPVWSWLFFSYLITVITIIYIPAFYYSTKIYKEFEDEQLKKKWRFLLIGIFLLYMLNFGTLFSNTLNIQTFRTVWSMISLILVIVSPYMMYYGVGKQIREQ